jgi:hypothetical protein
MHGEGDLTVSTIESAHVALAARRDERVREAIGNENERSLLCCRRRSVGIRAVSF